MSKRKETKPPENPRTEPAASFLEHPLVVCTLLAALVTAVYAASVQNQFVFFDDDKAILYNKTLEDPSLGKFFKGQNLGMYAPLSWIAYWVGSLLSGKEAWGYHLLGLVLHVLNTAMVYLLLRRLLGRHWPALFAAVLFGVHPVQVEAVSWAAALSTVLFASFYLGSLLAYLRWKSSATLPWLVLSLLLFLLACLSKSAAVTLPLVVAAFEVYLSKNLAGKFWLRISPYLAISLFFGAYTFVTRAQEGHDIEATSRAFSALDRFWMVCQTLLFYPAKVLAPLGFSISYPFVKVNGAWSWEYYAAPLALAVAGFLAWKHWRGMPERLLALALYVLPLTVMLPFRTVGSFELRSDRYAYLSVAGLFLLAGLLLESQKAALRNAVLAGLAVVSGYLTFQQTGVWKDGVALFENCVKKTPEASLCQCNLAYNELLNFDFENSARHYTEALKYDATTIEAYNGRGQAYFHLNKIPEALDDFTRAIQAGIVTPKLHLNRGKCLVMLNRPQEALPDLNRSLELEPKAPEAYYFRGLVFEKSGAPEKAVQDYGKAIELNPQYLEALVNRAVLFIGRQQYGAAIEDLSQALKINPRSEKVYNNRAYAYLKNGQPDKALEDLARAIELNPNYARAYQTRAVVYQQIGEAAKAQADLQMVQRLQGR